MRWTFSKNNASDNINQFQDNSESKKYKLLLCFPIILFVLSFLFNSPKEIWNGSIIILISPANLITDYFALANIGASLMNASVMAFISIAMLYKNKISITGPVIAAFFTVTGFSLFGKNLYNSIPIILGVYCYSKLNLVPFNHHILAALFGTSLGPLVSEITFNLNLPLPLGIFLGFIAGFLVGLALPPLSSYFLRFHQGFNLYNIGFTAGIIGTFFIGVFRNFGINVDTVSLVSSGNNMEFAIILYILFISMILLGLLNNNWSFKGYGKLLHQSGKLVTDFVSIYGIELTLINMALLGIISTSYVLLVGGELNGPVIGGIFTVVGFGAFGKHIKNVPPILLGIFLISLINLYEVNSTNTLLAVLFGTTLAPICGYYGPIAGIIAGALHMAMVMNISNLHAGMNLYNNGFSGGFVAAALVPILDSIIKIREIRKKRASENE